MFPALGQFPESATEHGECDQSGGCPVANQLCVHRRVSFCWYDETRRVNVTRLAPVELGDLAAEDLDRIRARRILIEPQPKRTFPQSWIHRDEHTPPGHNAFEHRGMQPRRVLP